MYKVIDGSKIVDVMDELTYIREQTNGVDVITTEDKAMGVISSDGSTRWHLFGRAEFSNRNFGNVIVVEITEEEGEQLKQQLFPQEPDNEEGTGGESGSDVEQYKPNIELQLKVNRMKAEMDELKETNASLQERSKFIEDCLMEMSEVVYA